MLNIVSEDIAHLAFKCPLNILCIKKQTSSQGKINPEKLNCWLRNKPAHKANESRKKFIPVIDRPAHHPHAVVGKRCDGEAGDQSKSVKGGDKDLAKAFIPLIIGVLAAQLDHAVHGDRDAHV